MKSLVRLVIAGSCFAAAGCAAPATSLNVGGDETTISGFILPVKETFEEENQVLLKVKEIKPGEELLELYAGKVDAIIATSSLQELLDEAAVKKINIDRASLHQVEVGQNRTIILLNKRNKIKTLSQKQLKGIFTGKFSNWRQLGGTNEEIIVVWDSSSASENDDFVGKILNDAPVVAKFKSANGYEEVRKMVTALPGAIGIAPSGFIAPGVKIPKTPKVTSPVILVAKKTTSPLVKNLIDLLKDASYIQ